MPGQTTPVFPHAALINARVDSSGELLIVPSAASSKDDFNFLKGKWTMDHLRLRERLKHSTQWDSLTSTDENYGPMLTGLAIVDILSGTFGGKPFQGLTLRLFNPQTRLWSLYWVPSTTGVMDPPVVGSFEGPIGSFYCKDVFDGRPIIVMFRWDKTDPDNPVWSQAFSPDGGKTWEWNWTNISHRRTD